MTLLHGLQISLTITGQQKKPYLQHCIYYIYIIMANYIFVYSFLLLCAVGTKDILKDVYKKIYVLKNHMKNNVSFCIYCFERSAEL